MTRLSRRALCGILIAGGAFAGTAGAATPDKGTVSSAAPKVTWAGQVTASWFTSRAVILTGDGSVPCQAPTCDSFALDVADQQNLEVGVSAPEAADQVIVRIKKPDGSYLVTTEDTNSSTYVIVKIKNAAKGSYVVDYWNYYTDGPVDYNGYAQLGSAAAAAPAPTTTTTTTTPSGGTSGGQQPAAKEDLSLTVKAGKASARKLAKTRKLAASVTVSRPVASISAKLLKGKKVVGTAKAGATSSTAKLSLKVAKKLKQGTYSLAVVADDGKGTTAAKTIKVRVTK
jgi:hypothetical protein